MIEKGNTLLPYDKRSKNRLDTGQELELSRSLNNPCDQLLPASWRIIHLSLSSVTVCFYMMEMSGKTDRDTLPGALEGGIPFMAVA